MFRFPLVIVYMIVAFNITAFTVVLLLNMLVIDSITAKIISCALSVGAWVLAYVNRHKVIKLF
ncbi:hypothetical protein GALL_101390 [mine drainage metagenome]|uniref:Uncharacterized protein n=1 Tax=mine drainage metagenome TaxID=410659 RepID=A0A1J5SHC5_9ZZZZ